MSSTRIQDSSCLTSKGNRYSYSYNPATPGLPTILFLHGFPSHKHDWDSQKDHFASLGYGVILVDLLGFGHSDAPDNQDCYRLESMSDDIIDLLDHVKAHGPVVGIAHDLGVFLLSRLAIYHPERVQALVYLAVGPHQLGQRFDLDAINQFTKQMLGHEYVGYISWMAGDPTAEKKLEKNAEAAMKLMFCADPTLWDSSFRPLGAMEAFVSEGRDVEVGSWFSPKMQEEHLRCYRRPGGYKGAIKWYKNMANNESLIDEERVKDQKQDKPTLLVAPEHEASQQKDQAASWHTRLELQPLSCGHWVHLEKAKETNQAIEAFVKSVSVEEDASRS
ncbi:alpha/beta hydrolase fold domain-containing protein [Sarocladium implicatum]|nr:alpha/beta hydrolase fold domain-containing protein [Sarocladium implicatum]